MRDNYKTSEVAKALGVSRSTLAMWEKAGDITKVHRDFQNNYRTYTLHDIEMIASEKDLTINYEKLGVY